MSTLSPASFPDSPLSRALSQPLMLGLFLPIQSGGWSMSTLPRTTDWTFDYNARLTRKAEALGFDLVFGLAQWLGKDGHGGTTRYRRDSLDSFITIASLASITNRILLISTLHILYGGWHPLHLAKFGATLDHISGGRWGLNMVTGHSVDEAEMFGREGHFEHDLRYEMAGEFVDLMEQLWSLDDNLTFDGKWYRTRNAFVSPKPRFGRPVLVNATSSPAGIDYAAQRSDLIFITSSAGAQIDAALEVLPAHTAQVQARAQAYGRQVSTLINPTIVCRPTEREAHAYHDAILSHADFGAVDGFTGRRSDAKAWKGHQREQRVLGGNIQIIGSPEHVVEDLLRLKAAGIGGVQLTFFDFEPDLAYFGEAVLPLLEQAGLRVPVQASA
ncbi:LLM class flavin-dependent oxidoreductase [Paraburkholderia dioscoreae]|uniref:Coenzyme F420-dependent N5,N10-methylene tetrahydromethanopterin reductase and related flavin-dependent oxidoreductases sulfonate monooxygenase n=1 Tax=Paraburkholderia dioscoreae TaxID=2604047 RepID=A0A5Q4ZG44_9BURK|nr:LLM class flavin-dependent oxidoreductase [Paraburkholderia dioscoreae]VVD31953.1 Coenzyme F420-dependent N5,N10-methylene tetrahydromethanopterin reductase and related flavin-dependent oxidoreductases; sulfonate monooxygenase [Paraburkholderia dioscoreae]